MTTDKRREAEVEVATSIRRLSAAAGYSPSFREVAEDTGLPLGTVHSVCVDLAEQGVLIYHPRIARSLRVKEDA